MINTTHLAYRVNTQTLTEYILIRETLWFDTNTFFSNFSFRFPFQAADEFNPITHLHDR